MAWRQIFKISLFFFSFVLNEFYLSDIKKKTQHTDTHALNSMRIIAEKKNHKEFLRNIAHVPYYVIQNKGTYTIYPIPPITEVA